ncbi:hypothetical protein VNO78_29117 [Psophocarpus tetragonolobus]|uniref:RING-type E3 ubiquitin transferase n=1 Tax=Psophocarpus tetragonolobus TaxID=3891 RepID=A0AAN9RUE1_PSOTE
MSSNRGGATTPLPPLNVTMVAVDRDKNSAYAFRWTTKHMDNPVIIAVHVKPLNIPHRRSRRKEYYERQRQNVVENETQGTNVFRPDEDDIANIFEPLRQMCCNDECHANVIKLKEAVVDDSDVVKGIVEYAKRNRVNTIVVGAPYSTKNTLARTLNLRGATKKFKGQDVSTGVMKAAPEYSSVYIISKGKIVGARPAIRPMVNVVATPKENGVRIQTQRRVSTNGRSERSPLLEMARSSSAGQSMNKRSKTFNLNSGGNDSSGSRKFGSTEGNKQDWDLGSSPDAKATMDMEAEMEMLRLKVKQTMDMYSSACKDAISAQNKAKEINQWKKERMAEEEAKLSKEAALAMAENEKLKAKATVEATDEAIEMVERETQRKFEADMKARREAQEKDRALPQLLCNDTKYRRYTIQDIEEATDDFSPSMRVGEGGYGPVFKGILDHTAVAIKILNPDATHGKRQFQQEVEVLCNMRHPNMVILLGACPEYGCLVYEYMENGSLEDRLLMKNDSPPIPWWKRFEIAAELATALLFLHQKKPDPVVHRDLKPANILLDKNFVGKISDVGLARLVPASVADSVTQYHMTAAAGTLCYIDPEYQQTGKLTTKSDIYSLGIMLLQIVTAKPAMGLAHHAERAIKKGTFSEMLDPAITDWPLEEALAFAKLALSCAELSKKDRPDLASVVVPELNRLRDFGLASQNNQSLSHPPTPLQSS